MSQAVFPVLPGITWNVLKAPAWSTKVQQSVAGKELRAQFFSRPLYTWTLIYEMLRSSATLELQTLIGFFNARQGKYDSFLFNDPADNNVAAHGFGVGDGATTAFQLQRTVGGYVTDPLGIWPVYTVPRKNLVIQSEGISVANGWTANSAPTSVVGAGQVGQVMLSNLGNCTVGWWSRPVSFTGNGTKAWSQVMQYAGSTGVTQSILYDVTAVTVRADARITWAADGTATAVALVGNLVSFNRLAGGAYLLLMQPVGIVAANANEIRPTNPTASTAANVLVGGVQVEDVPYSFYNSRYMPNAGAANAVNPLYYPAAGDGFEPVTDLQYAPAIFVAGVLKVFGSDYTISATGLVTFVAAPGAALAITWTGSYYWRVRFDLDQAEFNNFLSQLWEAKKIVFVSVK
jgi:hypothetical protein